MATMQENLDKVAEQSTRLDSIITLIDTTKAELDAILAGQLPPDVQAKVDSLFEGLKANDAKIDDALNTNVPAPAP